MPKRNFGFEKRQKELARQQKREAKLQRRRDRSEQAPAADTSDALPPAETAPTEFPT